MIVYLRQHLSKLILVLALLVSVSIVGCIPIVAATGAGVAYTLTADSVSDVVLKPKDTVVEQFIKIMNEEKALLLYTSISEGVVRAEKGELKYFFEVKMLEDKSSKFTLRIRKGYYLIPAKDEVLTVYHKLMKGLNQ